MIVLVTVGGRKQDDQNDEQSGASEAKLGRVHRSDAVHLIHFQPAQFDLIKLSCRTAGEYNS